MEDKNKKYPQIWPNIEDWPIYKLHQERKAFVQEIERFTLDRMLRKKPSVVTDVIAKTIYKEQIRIKEEPWKVDPPNERVFWKKIKNKLMRESLDQPDEKAALANKEILERIIHRYAEEIVGTFRISTFKFARKFLYFFFTRLLNTAASRNYKRIWSSKHKLYDKLKVRGEVETVRQLMKKGTLIVAPTHFSNLDSILIGYALDEVVGLPSFAYGAGLNLYNSGAAAYYMNRLGAYRVDRRKKNSVYLETLKTMSNLAIQRGTNSLFFPGGTRARSGALESNLKLGLLGTIVEAQRGIYQSGKEDKVFVVPLILGYHFVLEAKHLIEQHLRQVGREQYFVSRDGSHSFRLIVKFIWQLFSKSNEIVLSLGQPMDVLGNPVDAEGNSYDNYGNKIEVKEYFMSDDEVTEDIQRESQYTKALAEKITERYKKDNIVLSSHLVAFAAFEILKYENSRLDLYGILRLPPEDYQFSRDQLREVIGQLREVLIEMKSKGEIKLSGEVEGDLENLISQGIARMGNFHTLDPLMVNKKGQIVSKNFKILYYYHNRLSGYQLESKINWGKKQEATTEVSIEG
ncbi:MAG: 1-acyl-sn-glycerol-3-phosphate acyltransferase [Saprospiraceae bacterium]|nr:1-acyl-sn-glycerol-3-phosphate acyltransferase [Saprospiraceae bacterium]MCB9323383.1 1-acyl-sn-glycerol-3-phosphate acyltransferase [Lewinellaceae bacterium]